MKAKVKLLLDKAVESTDVEEARYIAHSMTPDKRTISIRINSENINLLEVTFKRFPGRQVDIVDCIFKPFRLYMDHVNDITVQFESKNKKF